MSSAKPAKSKTKLVLTRFEEQIMSQLWTRGRLSIREIGEGLDGRKKHAYTTIQTIVYRLETKGYARRVRKIGNAHIFEAAVSSTPFIISQIDTLLTFTGGNVLALLDTMREMGVVTATELYTHAETLMVSDKKKKGGN